VAVKTERETPVRKNSAKTFHGEPIGIAEAELFTGQMPVLLPTNSVKE